MNNRLFHAVASDSLKDEVLSNEVLPLVRELNHAYGLKVYAKSQTHGYEGYPMCNDEGLPMAKVFFHDDSYCYYSPYQQKSRGSDEFDRHTYRSKKLSTLMSTLKKANVVVTTNRFLEHNQRSLQTLINKTSSSFKDGSKDSLPPAHAQRILQAMLKGNGLDSFSQADRDLYLQILDEYEKVDIMKEVKKQGIESMFSDCYLVLGDVHGQYIISESSYEYAPPQYGGSRLEFKIKPTTTFKRVADLSEYPKILTALTMLKVHLGEDFRPFSGLTSNHLIPLGDRHLSDFDIVYGYQNRHTDFDMGYLCLAK